MVGKSRPRIWALLGAHAGDNDQVIALAETIGLPFEIKQLTYNRWRHAGPYLLRSSLISLTKSARTDILGEPPPDLTLSAGHRSVAVVRQLRRRSKGRTRSIHLGFPRISAGHFDLVITTPQYPMAEHPNLLRVPYALTRVATEAPVATDLQLLDTIPSPRHLLIVGGPTPFWSIDESALMNALGRMIEQARTGGGSIIVTTSPRTPRSTAKQLETVLKSSEVPFLLAAPGKPPRLFSMLGAADSVRVTGDSVSMISDALWTGKPVAVVPVKKSALGRVATHVFDRLRPGHRIYPQDLRYFWRALAEIGVTDTLAKPRASRKSVTTEIMRRVRPILGDTT